MLKPFSSLIWVVVAFAATTSVAGVWRVEQDGSGDFMTLQPAVDAAASGDTILIGPGRYTEMHTIVDESGADIEVYAYWNELKDLTFFGTGSSEVIFGPETYAPSGFSPKGIYSEEPNNLAVSDISFQNLYTSVKNYGVTTVEGCNFQAGDVGVFIWGASADIVQSTFSLLDYSVYSSACDSIFVRDCVLNDAKMYFGQTRYGSAQDCTVNGGALVNYYRSDGEVVNNMVYGSGPPCVNCSYGRVVVQSNSFYGGDCSISVEGADAYVEAYNNVLSTPVNYNFYSISYASLLAYNNDLYRDTLNQPYMVKANYYSNPSDAFIDVRNNYWGPLDSNEYFLNLRIWDGNDDPNLQIIVDYSPFSTVPLPTEEQSMDSFKSMFR